MEQTKKSIFKKWWFWAIIILVSIGMIASCGKTPTKEKTESTNTPTQENIQTSDNKEKTPEPVNIIFDVASLVGKNIDEIRNTLGDPVDKSKNLQEPTQEQINLGVSEWDNTFRKDDLDLLITFNISSRKVVDFFVGTSSKYSDKNKLMEITNTKDNDNSYKIEAVKALKNPNEITGIKIIPK